MPDIKQLSTKPGIDPGFKHLQHIVFATRPYPTHPLTTFLFYFTVLRFGWNELTTMSDIKKLWTQPGIDPGFKHLQHIVFATRPYPTHPLTTFLFYFTVSCFGWN
jgi:hypothetical protein